ncbi:MAG: alpha-mannosidase [Bacteroides sp.]|nr:alpha-mannosidase [Bacteroides sp.]
MKRTFFVLLSCVVYTLVYGQQVYFVDGYHGGIYGHYPVEWKTSYMMDLLSEYPWWRMGLEIEPETWDTVAVRTPEDYERFCRIATDKRVEFTNPAYAQPYCYNVSGESIIRQFGYGIQSIRNHFPEVEFVTYAVEEPCFTSSLPQILTQFGFRYAVLKCPNTCWGGYTAPYGGELVNWTGPDGSSILTVPRYACEELEPNSVWQTTVWGNETGYLQACFKAGIEHPVGMTYQDAGWRRGPWIGTGDSIKNNSVYVTWREYFEHISNGKTDDNYHLSQEDIRVSLMWGSQVLQRIARQVRQSENNLVIAEKMGVIANLSNGYRYKQEDLDEAWRTLMLTQHHDSWIVPYNRLHGQNTWANEIQNWTHEANLICGNILKEVSDSFTTGETGTKGVYLRVYNTLGVPRREIVSAELPGDFTGMNLNVTDATGKRIETCTTTEDSRSFIVFEAEVPAFGYATYYVIPDKRAENPCKTEATIRQEEIVLENSMYRIVIDPLKGGIIKSLIAKKEGNREFSDNNSEFNIGELRGFFYDEGLFHSSVEKPAVVSVVQENPFEKSVRIEGEIASHPFTQTITLREGQRKIDFDLTIDWKSNVGIGEYHQTDAYDNNRRAFYDDRFKLNVLFPVDLNSPVLYKNAPFDVCRSELENTHFNTWDSIKHNIILNWVDLADQKGEYGFSLLSDHTTSYSYGENFPLGLTVQFSGNGLWGRDYPIEGSTYIRFAVIPHSKEWDASHIHTESLRWNESLITSFQKDAKPENVSLINVEGTGYEIVASYLCDEGIMIRLFNADGNDAPRVIKFGTSLSKVEETDLNGNTLSTLPTLYTEGGTEVEVTMPRFGLKTLRLTPHQ